MSNKLIQKSNKQKKSLLIKINHYWHQVLDIVICIYMLLIICILPFYYTNGYVKLGTDKAYLFKNISAILIIPTVVLSILVHMIIFLCNKQQNILERFKSFLKTFSLTDIFVSCFTVVIIISYISSDYRQQALWGADRWGMGMLTQLVLISSYFLISRSWKIRNWLPGLFLPVSAIVFLLGYLNRFGIDLLGMERADNPQFISTIGNINWYCGYMVTVFFGGVYLLWNSGFTKLWQKVLLYLYVGIGFASLVTQGSSSGILTLIGILFVLFCLSVKDGSKMQAYCSIVFTLAMACLVTCGIRLLFPEAITYIEGTTDLLTYSMLPVIISVTAGCMGLWVSRRNRRGSYPVKLFCISAKVIAAVCVALCVGFSVLLIGNTWKPGSIGPFSDFSIFTFSPEWGSKRGVTWTAGIMCFMEQGFWKKLIGIGPDCMSSFIYDKGSDELLTLVRTHFGYTTLLTNAHGEWISVLANLGILGLVSFVGMIISSIVSFLRKGSGNNSTYHSIVGACGLCILAYTINNVFSFQQIMNGTALYIVLGIGEAYIKSFDSKTPK